MALTMSKVIIQFQCPVLVSSFNVQFQCPVFNVQFKCPESSKTGTEPLTSPLGRMEFSLIHHQQSMFKVPQNILSSQK